MLLDLKTVMSLDKVDLKQKLPYNEKIMKRLRAQLLQQDTTLLKTASL